MKIKNFINDVKRDIHKKYVRIITNLFYNIQTAKYSIKVVPNKMYGHVHLQIMHLLKVQFISIQLQ